MPLPDERPRQSVANLIGRFEQQTKRQPVTGSPRSSSVASHNTGDSLKEDIKEKREWPPRSLHSNDKPPLPFVPSSSWSRQSAPAAVAPPAPQPSIISPNIFKADLPPAATANNIKPSSIQLSPQEPITPIPEPASTPQQDSNYSAAAAKPASKPDARPPVVSAKTPASKASLPSSKAPQKPPTKSTAKATPSTPTKPIKAQHTGQSTVSTATVRHAKVTPKNVPPTPKTPSTVSRPKTPSSSTLRPKTPSGLFAPTAASLARARNAEPHPPAPTKKVTLSSGAAERLSKPTAASMSKARSPPSLPASPAKARASASPAATRGGVIKAGVKPKVKASPMKAKSEKEKSTAPAVAPVVVPQNEHSENGHGIEEPAAMEPTVADVEPDVEGPGRNDEVLEEEESREVEEDAEIMEPEYEEDGIQHSPEASTDNEPELEQEQDPEPEQSPILDDSTETSSQLHHTPDVALSKHEERMDEVKPGVHVGSDIEDIVNLLEAVPVARARPPSVASITGDVHEIPDEE